jgi:hypothetical protein
MPQAHQWYLIDWICLKGYSQVEDELSILPLHGVVPIYSRIFPFQAVIWIVAMCDPLAAPDIGNEEK